MNIFGNDKNAPTAELHQPFRVIVVENLKTGSRRVVAGQDARSFATIAEADEPFLAEYERVTERLDPLEQRVRILYARTVSDWQLEGLDAVQAQEWAAKLGMESGG